MKEVKHELAIEERYRNQFITVSNEIVRAREKTNLLESKIEALAMYYMSKDMKQREKKDANGNNYIVNYVVLPAKEISSLMYNDGKPRGGKTYLDIKRAAISLKQKLYIIENKEEERFYLDNMYGAVVYDKGSMYVEFNPDMEKYFMNLKQNFSKLKLPILFSFKFNGGFQLYKLLKSYAYPPNLNAIDITLSQEEQSIYAVSFSITDLRMEMGYIDINQPLLKEEGTKRKPNWEKMEKLEKAPAYKRWSDFYVRVIEPGIKEINELPSDIYIKDVIKDTCGRGAKVVGLTFVIQHNKKYYEMNGKIPPKKVSESINVDDFIDELEDMIEEKVKLKDLKAIAEASGYDIEKIRRIYGLSKTQDINNLVGFLIAGLKGNYSDNINNKPVNRSNKHGFKERTYDYDELERNAVGL